MVMVWVVVLFSSLTRSAVSQLCRMPVDVGVLSVDWDDDGSHVGVGDWDD